MVGRPHLERKLHTRLETNDGWKLNEGPITQKSVTPMRSFVAEPMQIRPFIPGRRRGPYRSADRSQKGMNSAVADVKVLAHAHSMRPCIAMERRKYARLPIRPPAWKHVWRKQHFSWWMTSMMHRFADNTAFQDHMQLSELNYLFNSRAAATMFAENYVGLPTE